MLLLQTLVQLIIFLLLSFLIFYILGFWLVTKVKQDLENQEIIVLAMCLGVVFFVLLGSIFGLLHLRFLVLPLMIVIIAVGVIKFRQIMFTPWKIFIRDKIFSLLLIAGILIQGLINFPSGFLYKEGLYFWSSQGHDGLWHVASMEEIVKHFPPQNPGFAGESLYNYHYLVDVLMGEFHRIFPFFSSLDLYFRFFPIIFSFLIGLSVFAFVSRWKGNKKIGYLALFFTYFTGSFGWIVNFTRTGNIFGGETVFWASQINTIIGNPPHAIAISLLTSFFLSFYFYLKHRSKIWFIISFLLASVLAGFKVSAGVVMLAGLGVVTLIDLIKTRKLTIVYLCGLLGLSNLATIKLVTHGAESFLMFLPWWFIRTMVVVKLDWLDLELRRQHYLAQGTWHADLRVIQLETEAFLIFLVGNLGMRILGFYELGKKIINRRFHLFDNSLEMMLIVTMLTGFLIPLFFVQRGLIYNNIQFMQYFLLIFGFYAAIAAYKLLKICRWKWFKFLVMVIIVCLSIPTVIGNLVEFYNRPPLAKITNEELVALNYLKNNSTQDKVVLTAPFNKYLNTKFTTQPWPIYAWYDTSYVSALSSRRSYLASEHVTLLDYPDTHKRQENMSKFFEQKDLDFNKKFLFDANISFIYINKDELDKSFNPQDLPLKVFFENNKVIIYEVVS